MHDLQSQNEYLIIDCRDTWKNEMFVTSQLIFYSVRVWIVYFKGLLFIFCQDWAASFIVTANEPCPYNAEISFQTSLCQLEFQR